MCMCDVTPSWHFALTTANYIRVNLCSFEFKLIKHCHLLDTDMNNMHLLHTYKVNTCFVLAYVHELFAIHLYFTVTSFVFSNHILKLLCKSHVFSLFTG